MPITAAVPATTDAVTPAVERRVVCLDGVRGLITIMVLVSHYFGEVAHGIRAVMFGWIAVDMFFVLSGYLVGKTILANQRSDNFLQVFYIRRISRTLPIYAICLVVNFVLMAAIAAPWVDAQHPLPFWSYFTSTQNIFMAATSNLGAHWLWPTWTLAVEEHFYLTVPILFFVVPRRHIVPALMAIALCAVLLRAATFAFMEHHGFIALVLLPTRADILAAGLLAAFAIKSDKIPWQRIDYPLRLAPVILLLVAAILRITDKDSGHSFDIFAPMLVSLGCAIFLLTLLRGAPEARRFHSKFLGFFAKTSYAVYLTHLPVLGLMHGFILGTRPDLATGAQWAVTFAAIPVSVLIAWLLTIFVEKPLTRYGRTWTFSHRPRVARVNQGAMAYSPAE